MKEQKLWLKKSLLSAETLCTHTVNLCSAHLIKRKSDTPRGLSLQFLSRASCRLEWFRLEFLFTRDSLLNSCSLTTKTSSTSSSASYPTLLAYSTPPWASSKATWKEYRNRRDNVVVVVQRMLPTEMKYEIRVLHDSPRCCVGQVSLYYCDSTWHLHRVDCGDESLSDVGIDCICIGT